MQLTRPSIRHLDIEPPAVRVPSAPDAVFPWFTSGPAPLPYNPTLLRWGRYTLGLVLEVLARRRASEQIAPWITPQVTRYVRARLHTMDATRLTQPPRLLSLRLFQPHQDAGELAAVYCTGPRVHALAARADRPPDSQEAWTLTALRLG